MTRKTCINCAGYWHPFNFCKAEFSLTVGDGLPTSFNLCNSKSARYCCSLNRSLLLPASAQAFARLGWSDIYFYRLRLAHLHKAQVIKDLSVFALHP